MIKKWLEKIFGKFCKCEEIDEHITMYTEIPELEIPLVLTVEEKIVCWTHNRFKKSCPICQEAGKK